VQDMTGSSTSAHLYILHEGNIHSYRQVFMDGRKHPAELETPELLRVYQRVYPDDRGAETVEIHK